MKKAKKIVALLLCAVLLIGASIAGTLAFLTSKATVTNSFTVGKVVLGGDDGEAGLDEAKVDEYGVAVTPAARVTENTYKLIPGHTYTKDPTIHVGADSEAFWLFVKVENDIEAIEAKDVEGQAATTIASQMAARGWNVHDAENGIYVYFEPVSTVDAAAKDIPIFVSFTLAKDADVADYEGKNITVTAYAIQKDGLTVSEAWTALQEEYPANT